MHALMLSQKPDSYCLSGKLLFEDGEPLTFGDFMRGILTLRGSNQTTVKAIRLALMLTAMHSDAIPYRPHQRGVVAIL